MIGIITYHSAYNYGSILQALATQEVVKSLTNRQVEVINYRLAAQKDFYKLYRTNQGAKTLFKDLLQLPIHKNRSLRSRRFEDFINQRFNLSEEITFPEDIGSVFDRYETVISGSDQIWNKHSEELKDISWKHMEPYLLAGYKGKKISYASSVGNMTEDEIKKIIPYLKRFNAISMREPSSANRLSNTMKCNIPWVVDPTFLLHSNDWVSLLNLNKVDKNYILFYSLCGTKTLASFLPILKQRAKLNNLGLKIITPFAYLPINEDNIELIADAGPVEFLELIYNCKEVITNSYHGTVLSINFEKEVISICNSGGTEFRKKEILEELRIPERILGWNDDFLKVLPPINYSDVNYRLDIYRNRSMDYLRRALK